MGVDEVVRALTGITHSLEETKSPAGLPAQPGLYAWWTKKGSIPGVPACLHPTEQDLDLFYVGISPKNGSSKGTIRSRVLGQHIGGNIGSSTLRKTLASLLFEIMGWEPIMRSRPLLTPSDTRALTRWQHKHLNLTWVAHPEPWKIEAEVIRILQPPLNLAGNKSHPFASTVSEARRRLAKAARLGHGLGSKGAENQERSAGFNGIDEIVRSKSMRWM
jgi:hypothetical protein